MGFLEPVPGINILIPKLRQLGSKGIFQCYFLLNYLDYYLLEYIGQNIKNVIFDSDHSRFGVRTYFRRLFKPFKHVHIMPSFTDQTGRGGLRGTIEVDIGQRWRALAQKNFSLSEDTRFELEYLLSDDIAVRGVRDEHGDVSSEVEMRWKF